MSGSVDARSSERKTRKEKLPWCRFDSGLAVENAAGPLRVLLGAELRIADLGSILLLVSEPRP
jgi:hypothetical protein